MPIIKYRPGALIVIVVLIFLCLSGILLRTLWLKEGGVPEGDRVWQLTFEFKFHAAKGGTVAQMALPADTAHVRVFSQNFYHPLLRLERSKGSTGEMRAVRFVASLAGEMGLKAEFQIHQSANPHRRKDTKGASLSASLRDQYLSSEPNIQTDDESILRLHQRLSENVTDQGKLLENIADFCEKKIIAGPAGGPSDAAGVLLNLKATPLGRSRAMTALCRVSKIPARVVAGFILNENSNTLPFYWVEAFVGKKWISFDPENGHRGELPPRYLPVKWGSSEILEIKGDPKIDRKFTIIPLAVPRGLFSSDKKRVYEILDLTRLPMATQNSLMILLMLPFGALVTTFFRNIIGIRTIGTFTPTLLALATVYADWITATLIFFVVVVIGIWGRSALPGLKLLKVPRLSLVFTLVAVVMTFTISALDFVNLNPAGHIVLLPMVVLTSIVDRFYTAWEEDGMRIAFKRLGWTILVALCCVVFFRWQSLGRTLLTYPELHCLTLSLILLLGLYGAKKLTDIPVFKSLAEGPKSPRNKKSAKNDEGLNK